jgi:hypothetical protein
METIENLKQAYVVYIGKFELKKGGMGFSYILLETKPTFKDCVVDNISDEQIKNAAQITVRKALKDLSIGAVIDIIVKSEVGDNLQIAQGVRNYLGRVNSTLAQLWTIENNTRLTLIAEHKEANKAVQIDSIEVFKIAYKKASWQGKNKLLADLIRRVTS